MHHQTDTILLFWHDAYRYENLTTVMSAGEDEYGFYIVPEATCYYLGGGGQERDAGWFQTESGSRYPIIKARMAAGQLRHYTDIGDGCLNQSEAIRIQIDEDKRQHNTRLHSAGHLIASIISEELCRDVVPTKGHHFPTGSYVEFAPALLELDLQQINMHIKKSVTDNLPLSSVIVEPDCDDYQNLKQMCLVNDAHSRALRLIKVGAWAYYPCNGTHVKTTSELDGLVATKVKKVKNNVRVSYTLDSP